MELNPSKNSLLTKTNSKSKLPILSRSDGVVDSSALCTDSVSALDVSFDSDSDSTPESEVLQNMESLGVPTACNNLLIGKPCNAIAGTYRILLHRKQLSPESQEREHSATEPQERRKKLSSCSMGGGQPLASESQQRTSSGGSVHNCKHKSAKTAKKDRKQQDTTTSSKHMSKIYYVLFYSINFIYVCIHPSNGLFHTIIINHYY